jgi:hypothetical protein
MHALAARFDLVAVRSASVDRRSLSQAWYDSLRLASRGCLGPRRANVPLRNARLFHPGKVCSPTFPSRHPWLREKLERPSGNVPRIADPKPNLSDTRERRARLSVLASDIVARLRSEPRATRFVFEVPQGRVCLYVVRGERSSQVVAFCPSALRDVVERALVQVRYAL